MRSLRTLLILVVFPLLATTSLARVVRVEVLDHSAFRIGHRPARFHEIAKLGFRRCGSEPM